jgi:putative addiction module component (TIGR02574 family)
MANKPSLTQIRELTPAERILLVEEIWDSLASEAESVPVTEAQRRELDERLEAHRRNPHAGAEWDQVKARIGRKK